MAAAWISKETEQHLTRKAALVLERAFGSGRALASVDVTLNLDQVRITTEDVIPAPMQRNQIATGVVIRERETLRDALAPWSEMRQQVRRYFAKRNRVFRRAPCRAGHIAARVD